MDISKPCIILVMIILGIWCLHEHREFGLFMFPVYMINTSNLAFRCLFSSKLFSICISIMTYCKDETPLQKWDAFAAITVNWLTATSWLLTFLFFEKKCLKSMLSGGENISNQEIVKFDFHCINNVLNIWCVCLTSATGTASYNRSELSTVTMATLLEKCARYVRICLGTK